MFKKIKRDSTQIYLVYWRFKRSSCGIVISGIEIDTPRAQRNSTISTWRDFSNSPYGLIYLFNQLIVLIYFEITIVNFFWLNE